MEPNAGVPDFDSIVDQVNVKFNKDKKLEKNEPYTPYDPILYYKIHNSIQKDFNPPIILIDNLDLGDYPFSEFLARAQVS